MRVTLDEEDFHALVSGQEVEKQVRGDNGGLPVTLTLILEDIGFEVMNDSLKAAIIEVWNPSPAS